MLKAGLIGCGEMGEIHSDCLLKLKGMKMSAFCDLDITNAKRLKKKFNGDYFTNNYLDLLKDPDLSAIYICTHHDSHAKLAIECCKYKKNIMIEKPLALNIRDLKKIGDAVKKSNIIFMIGMKARFYPVIKKAKKCIHKPIVTIAQMMDLKWDDDFWANDPFKGGGNVLSQGCHVMDLIYYLNESEPVSIYAIGGNYNHPNLNIIDNICATVTFANGSIASVSIGDAGRSELVSKFSFQIFDGSKSVHLYDRLKKGVFSEYDKSFTHIDNEEKAFIEENKYFIDCLKKMKMPDVGYKDGYRATIMVLKAFESIKTGKPQTIQI